MTVELTFENVQTFEKASSIRNVLREMTIKLKFLKSQLFTKSTA